LLHNVLSSNITLLLVQITGYTLDLELQEEDA
jgi:hypothetical protein